MPSRCADCRSSYASRPGVLRCAHSVFTALAGFWVIFLIHSHARVRAASPLLCGAPRTVRGPPAAPALASAPRQPRRGGTRGEGARAHTRRRTRRRPEVLLLCSPAGLVALASPREEGRPIERARSRRKDANTTKQHNKGRVQRRPSAAVWLAGRRATRSRRPGARRSLLALVAAAAARDARIATAAAPAAVAMGKGAMMLLLLPRRRRAAARATGRTSADASTTAASSTPSVSRPSRAGRRKPTERAGGALRRRPERRAGRRSLRRLAPADGEARDVEERVDELTDVAVGRERLDRADDARVVREREILGRASRARTAVPLLSGLREARGHLRTRGMTSSISLRRRRSILTRYMASISPSTSIDPYAIHSVYLCVDVDRSVP